MFHFIVIISCLIQQPSPAAALDNLAAASFVSAFSANTMARSIHRRKFWEFCNRRGWARPC